MRFDTSDEEFRRQADSWLRSLADEIITDLNKVFRLSPGYYPTTLVDLWRVEINRRRLADMSLPQANSNREMRLPVCHPCDYEWRFTDETALMILGQVASDLPSGALVAHLGTPTTFVLGHKHLATLKHVLLERNVPIVDALRAAGQVHAVDLCTEDPPRLGADAAVLDPPWYPADTHAFLVATSRICKAGARIVLCQPALATRPGVAEERAALLGELPRLGLICREVDAACIRYHMPHFEASSLKIAAPDLIIPDEWRVGDVLRLEKIRDVPSLPKCPTPTEFWREATFGPVRIKLRKAGAPDLGSLVPGDILDTVSRRDPIRTRIGLWTSGNRVFSLEDYETIGRLIELCHIDVTQAQFTLRRTLSHARTVGVAEGIAQQLFDLLLIELQEHMLREKELNHL
jgi:hypothetical protein